MPPKVTNEGGFLFGKQSYGIPQQLVDEQGNITTLPGAVGAMGYGDWSDSGAYRASMYSQMEQRAYDLSLWKYQTNFLNDYYSPANQMKRFGEAGLNPNLIYGQMAATPTASMQSSSPLKAQSNYGRTLSRVMDATQGVIGSLMSIFDLVERGRMTDSVVKAQNAQTQYQQEQARNLFLENKRKEWYYFGTPYFFEGPPGEHGNVEVKTFEDGLYSKQEKQKYQNAKEQQAIMQQRIKNYVAELERQGASKEYIEQQKQWLESQYGWINSIESPFLRGLAAWLMQNVSLPSVTIRK